MRVIATIGAVVLALSGAWMAFMGAVFGQGYLVVLGLVMIAGGFFGVVLVELQRNR
jgi:hypothetical protein